MPALSCTVHGCAAFATWPAGVELTKSICAILHELTGAGRGRRWEEASHRSCHCRSPGGQLHCAAEARTAGPSPVVRRAEARHSAGRRHAAEGAHHCARRGESGSAGARPQERALGIGSRAASTIAGRRPCAAAARHSAAGRRSACRLHGAAAAPRSACCLRTRAGAGAHSRGGHSRRILVESGKSVGAPEEDLGSGSFRRRFG